MERSKLSDHLPEVVRIALEREIDDWQRKAPERLKDESSLRYIYASVLERFSIPCPHPYRTYYGKTFECRLCRSCFVPYEEHHDPDHTEKE